MKGGKRLTQGRFGCCPAFGDEQRKAVQQQIGEATRTIGDSGAKRSVGDLTQMAVAEVLMYSPRRLSYREVAALAEAATQDLAA